MHVPGADVDRASDVGGDGTAAPVVRAGAARSVPPEGADHVGEPIPGRRRAGLVDLHLHDDPAVGASGGVRPDLDAAVLPIRADVVEDRCRAVRVDAKDREEDGRRHRRVARLEGEPGEAEVVVGPVLDLQGDGVVVARGGASDDLQEGPRDDRVVRRRPVADLAAAAVVVEGSSRIAARVVVAAVAGLAVAPRAEAVAVGVAVRARHLVGEGGPGREDRREDECRREKAAKWELRHRSLLTRARGGRGGPDSTVLEQCSLAAPSASPERVNPQGRCSARLPAEAVSAGGPRRRCLASACLQDHRAWTLRVAAAG